MASLAETCFNIRVRSPRPPGRRGRAFTLVEIILIFSILGILAALVVPRFSNASEIARNNALKEDLRMLRTQIMVYRAQHGGIPPGHPHGDSTLAPTMEAFVNQMTLYSSPSGKTSATPSAQYTLGPYLLKMPVNPLNGSSEIKFIPESQAFPTDPDGTTGWIYQAKTGQFAANVAGTDSDGKKYFDY